MKYFKLVTFSILIILSSFLCPESLAQTEVSGAVSGEWLLDDSPFIVVGNLIVRGDNELEIEPGVQVLFDGAYLFLINGLLTAVGSEDDSIEFTRNDDDIRWRGLRIINADDDTQISYCIIEHSETVGNSEDMGTRGAGIFCSRTDALISHNTIRFNEADGYTAGIYTIDCNADVLYNHVHDNEAYTNGAVEIDNSYATISHNVIEGNRARHGGGMLIYRGAPTVEYNIIRGNDSWIMDWGGGLYFAHSCRADVRYNLIADNQGGGVYAGASAEIDVFENNTIVNNPGRCGILVYQNSSYINMKNCILFGHNDPIYLSGGHLSAEYSNIEDLNENEIQVGEGVIDEDPLFADPDEGDYHLSEDSPCIDTGDPDSPEDPDETRADMGAFYFNQRQSEVLNVPDDYEHIQSAIDAAEDGDIVLVQPGEYVENIDFIGKNIVVASLYLNDPDEEYIDETIIDGDGAASVVTIENEETEDAVLIGFTIQDGGGDNIRGGGIHIDSANPTISYCKVTQNDARYGGGVYLNNSSSRIDNCEIIGNTALMGGGVYFTNCGEAILSHCTIALNSEVEIGGGVCLHDCNTIEFNYCLISYNFSVSGGGIYCIDSELGLINCTISNNRALRTPGGGIHSVDGTLVDVNNTILWDNTPVQLYCQGDDFVNGFTYCDIEGGEDGIENDGEGEISWGRGNIDEDPDFVDAGHGDYHLEENSPCIDTGDPDSPEDPDETRADMGAYYFHQEEEGNPIIVVDPMELHFGEVDVDEIAEQSITIANEGDADLIIEEILVEEEDYFSIEFEDEIVIEPEEVVEITVSFSPEEAGGVEGMLLIISNDPENEEVVVELSGIGIGGGDEIGFTEHVIVNNFNHAISTFAKDIDGDGDIDVLGAAVQDDDITWWENDGDQNFTEHVIDGNYDGAISCFAIDLDSDGDVDILGAASNADEITWWENDGDEEFTEHTIASNYNYVSCVFAIDVDNDGDIDVLGTAYSGDDITWWENDGDQDFTEHTLDGNFSGAWNVYATDIDGDDDIDILGAAYGANDIAWWENDGDQDFTKHTIIDNFDGVLCVYAADLDSDGDVDVLGAARGADNITWWENDGEQNFDGHIITDEYDGTRSVCVADINNDGHLDVLGVAANDDDISWWENDGEENFVKHIISDQIDNPHCVFTEDIDSDGDIDVLGAMYSGDQITWWENNLDPPLPEIVVDPDVIVFIDTDVDELDAQSVTIGNAGEGDLIITEISVEGNYFSVEFEDEIILEPDDEVEVVVSFSPEEEGEFEGIVIINSNDPENEEVVVALSGVGVGDDEIEFTEHLVDGNFDYASSVYATDVDGDGDMDVLGAAREADDITWWEKDGDQDFTEH
ncbi:MAG: VCBS repeat-containing protein, partial [Calditrichaeota bacterium]|nr:VCBS repeat-containing protein [Calditrichota bacterium]